MIGRERLVTRIALFSALAYVMAFATAYLPNISLLYFVIFTAGFVWGPLAGTVVGLVGEGLFTTFNPYGPAPLPVAIAQVGGAVLCGLIGASLRPFGLSTMSVLRRSVVLGFVGLACGLAFFTPVSIVDAWLWQPFWPRLIAGFAWSVWALAANAVIFPLLFPVTLRLYLREGSKE
jgi:uncharacterized membrane protein